MSGHIHSSYLLYLLKLFLICLSSLTDEWVDLVDIVIIHIGCTDVTWSCVEFSLDGLHFLSVCGWQVQVMRISRRC